MCITRVQGVHIITVNGAAGTVTHATARPATSTPACTPVLPLAAISRPGSSLLRATGTTIRGVTTPYQRAARRSPDTASHLRDGAHGGVSPAAVHVAEHVHVLSGGVVCRGAVRARGCSTISRQ